VPANWCGDRHSGPPAARLSCRRGAHCPWLTMHDCLAPGERAVQLAWSELDVDAVTVHGDAVDEAL